MYCECFKNDKVCNELCKCFNCENKIKSKKRFKAMNEAIKNNDSAFL